MAESNRMFKILGFDNWTGGAHHFERLVTAFRKQGLELSLVHLGSWGNDPNRPPRETIGNLELRDISSYGSHSLTHLLDVEQPAAVLFFSTDTFAHRALNRYCRQRGIPTVHVYHGVIRVQAIDRGSMFEVNFLAQCRFAGSRLFKALRFVWPTYAKALYKTGASWREWRRFGEDILNITGGRYIKVSAYDAHTSKCGVYTEADASHARDKYGFSSGDVVAVGNPDLILFGLNESLIEWHLENVRTEATDVMYIDTGLIYTGWIFASEAEFIGHIIDTAERLKRQGRRLLFKPHPDHRRSSVLPQLAKAGVEICANQDFVVRLQNCCAAITEPSSLSLVPALMGMPLFLAGFGKLRGCPFGEVLLTYPRGTILEAVEDVNRHLAAAGEYDMIATQKWIRENAGPLPAEQMPERVAQLFNSLFE